VGLVGLQAEYGDPSHRSQKARPQAQDEGYKRELFHIRDLL